MEHIKSNLTEAGASLIHNQSTLSILASDTPLPYKMRIRLEEFTPPPTVNYFNQRVGKWLNLMIISGEASGVEAVQRVKSESDGLSYL